MIPTLSVTVLRKKKGVDKVKNTLADLNNHLFMQIERLGDEELKGEKLEEEIKRAQAITSVSAQVINNGELVLKASKFMQEFGYTKRDIKEIPPMLRSSLMGE